MVDYLSEDEILKHTAWRLVGNERPVCGWFSAEPGAGTIRLSVREIDFLVMGPYFPVNALKTFPNTVRINEGIAACLNHRHLNL